MTCQPSETSCYKESQVKKRDILMKICRHFGKFKSYWHLGRRLGLSMLTGNKEFYSVLEQVQKYSTEAAELSTTVKEASNIKYV